MFATYEMRELAHENEFKYQTNNGDSTEGQSPGWRGGINRDARNRRRKTENEGSVAQEKSAASGAGNVLAAGDENGHANRSKGRERDQCKQSELNSCRHSDVSRRNAIIATVR